MTEPLSHVGPEGNARMVDVSGKPVTLRTARAAGQIRMARATLEAIQANALKKGDVLGVARVAGVMAAKRTAGLIPLCHPVPLDDLQVSLTPDPDLPGIRAEATARSTGRTGVEMEAIVAVTLALVTVYDMAKAADREMVIGEVRLVEKTGGQRGDYARG
ncbi:MAG: cyclic pyranopterin monophosphate synthase MoaC [Gemmatimonadota bacterium]|nr:cyclic pyranopterin monophosphate synthase MoaC [Gemmatimonadota bacterium]MDE3217647.1 cyclic pyranopterin monophosphate synthase MoaC [Gemmatimonadota bacterium]